MIQLPRSFCGSSECSSMKACELSPASCIEPECSRQLGHWALVHDVAPAGTRKAAAMTIVLALYAEYSFVIHVVITATHTRARRSFEPQGHAMLAASQNFASSIHQSPEFGAIVGQTCWDGSVCKSPEKPWVVSARISSHGSTDRSQVSSHANHSASSIGASWLS